MKNVLKLPVLALFSLLLTSCYSGRKAIESDAVVSPLADKITVNGGSIIYALPRTVFNIVVETERTIEIPGPYARYASDLLGLTNVIKNERESWLIKGVKVVSLQELDPAKYYVIESTTPFISNILSLKNEGLIMEINPSVYYSAGNEKGLETGGSGRFISSDLGSDEYFMIDRDTAFKKVNIDSTFIQIPYIVEKRKQLPKDQLAERAAKRLMEMRDGKHFILTGEANVFPQSDAAINEMNRLEKEYTELFTGKTIREKRSFTFQVIPSQDNTGKPIELFRFSEEMGQVKTGQQGGDPLTLTLTPENRTKELAIVRNSSESRKTDQQDKLYYRVPDVVNMKINLGDEVLFNSRRLVYQYGEIIKLPANLVPVE
ncbi:MAG TPA: DUF4831 family protein [Bacteroidales bacterium]|nr:DUF4831 family protein [Bacteroidales bacterium]